MYLLQTSDVRKSYVWVRVQIAKGAVLVAALLAWPYNLRVCKFYSIYEISYFAFRFDFSCGKLRGDPWGRKSSGDPPKRRQTRLNGNRRGGRIGRKRDFENYETENEANNHSSVARYEWVNLLDTRAKWRWKSIPLRCWVQWLDAI